MPRPSISTQEGDCQRDKGWGFIDEMDEEGDRDRDTDGASVQAMAVLGSLCSGMLPAWPASTD